MDTNLLMQLLHAQQAKGAGFDPNTFMVVGMVIAAVAPTLAAVAGWLKSKSAEETAVKTADEVKNIHAAVNSERTAMLSKVQELTDKVLSVSKENEVLKEKLSESSRQAVAAPAAAAASPATIAAIKETTDAVKGVQEIVATEQSVASLIEELKKVLILDAQRKK